MLSDSYFKAPCDKMVKLLLRKNLKTYMYVLNSTLDGLQAIKTHDFNLLGNGEYFPFQISLVRVHIIFSFCNIKLTL